MNENSLYEKTPSAPQGGPLNGPLSGQIYPDIKQVQNTFTDDNYRRSGSAGGFTCNSQQYRLVEIQRMRSSVEAKIKHNLAKCKKYKNQATTTEYINACLSSIAVLTGSTAAVTTIPVITAPLVALPLGIISAVTGVSSGIVLAISRSRRKKLSSVTDCLIAEKSTYNAIIAYISKAINDSFITDDEFSHVSKLYENMENSENSELNNAKKSSDNDINLLAAEIASVIARTNFKQNK